MRRPSDLCGYPFHQEYFRGSLPLLYVTTAQAHIDFDALKISAGFDGSRVV